MIITLNGDRGKWQIRLANKIRRRFKPKWLKIILWDGWKKVKIEIEH